MRSFALPASLIPLLAACDSTSSMTAGPARSLEGAVRYEVTLTPEWSARTHPVDYPATTLLSGPHFSGLIGASHARGYAVFAEGATPTPGLERLSEEGKHAPLDAEIRAAMADGRAGALFETGPVKDLARSVTTTVEVSPAFPRVSAVAMIAPSPDWFAGAADVDLREGGTWVAEKEVLLRAYDSGGDGGATYTSADDDASPKEPTRLNDAAPFVRDGERLPVGKLVFRRIG